MLEMMYFTEPTCTWCWGSQPLLQSILVHYKDQIRFMPVTCGMIEDIRRMIDPELGIGGSPARSNAALAKHWLEASKQHGMPVKTEGLALFTDAHPSSYPQNIAYKAAQFQEDHDLAELYLRRIQEQTACGVQTNRIAVLLALAKELGLDPELLVDDMDSYALMAFADDLRLVDYYEIQSFPTFLFRNGKRTVQLSGLPSYQRVQEVILDLSGGRLHPQVPEATDEALFAFIRKLHRVAPIELRSVFQEDKARIASWLAKQVEAGRLKHIPAGNGSLYALRPECM